MAGGYGTRLEHLERLQRVRDAAKRQTRWTTHARPPVVWRATLGYTSILDLKILPRSVEQMVCPVAQSVKADTSKQTATVLLVHFEPAGRVDLLTAGEVLVDL